jgi:hypothetical protein
MSLHRYHIPRNSSTTPAGSAVSFCGIRQCYDQMLNQPKFLVCGANRAFDSRCRFPIGSSADQRFMPWNLIRGLENPGLGIKLFIPWALSNVRSSLWNICSLIYPRFCFWRLVMAGHPNIEKIVRLSKLSFIMLRNTVRFLFSYSTPAYFHSALSDVPLSHFPGPSHSCQIAQQAKRLLRSDFTIRLDLFTRHHCHWCMCPILHIRNLSAWGSLRPISRDWI